MEKGHLIYYLYMVYPFWVRVFSYKFLKCLGFCFFVHSYPFQFLYFINFPSGFTLLHCLGCLGKLLIVLFYSYSLEFSWILGEFSWIRLFRAYPERLVLFVLLGLDRIIWVLTLFFWFDFEFLGFFFFFFVPVLEFLLFLMEWIKGSCWILLGCIFCLGIGEQWWMVQSCSCSNTW